MKDYENSNGSKADDYREAPLYGLLTCGVLLVLIGIYLTFSHTIAVSLGLVSRYTGKATNYVNGPSTIIIGLAGCSIPIYVMIKHHLKNKSSKK